jgi:OmpA-OmpF porin, OOP family
VRIWGLALALLVCSRAPARSSPQVELRLETGGFVGIGWFPANIELGNSWAPEQVPSSAPVVGGRAGYLVVPELIAIRGARLQLAIEAELAFATSFTGEDTERGRRSYFAPVLGWRAHAALRLDTSRAVRPLLVVGAGGESVVSSSPFMARETDPVAYWGPGVTIALSRRWQLRLDLRHGVMAARDAGATSTLTLQLGVTAAFGEPVPVRAVVSPPTIEVTRAQDSELDRDGDGIPDSLDRCPDEPGPHGCPVAPPDRAPDRDGDGIPDAADVCPDAAEDRDGFEDADGCPDLDDDGDGIPDATDACPREPETRNGFADADGCPDTIPDAVTRALAAQLVFEPGRARLTPAIQRSLAPMFEALTTHRDLRLVVVARPERAGRDDLARRRAEAIRWHLIDRGISQDRLTTRLAPPGTPTIELTLAID